MRQGYRGWGTAAGWRMRSLLPDTVTPGFWHGHRGFRCLKSAEESVRDGLRATEARRAKKVKVTLPEKA